MKRAETGRPHLFRLIAMIHKTAYILAYDMLRRKGGHDWVERRAGGIIGLPYLINFGGITYAKRRPE